MAAASIINTVESNGSLCGGRTVSHARSVVPRSGNRRSFRPNDRKWHSGSPGIPVVAHVAPHNNTCEEQAHADSKYTPTSSMSFAGGFYIAQGKLGVGSVRWMDRQWLGSRQGRIVGERSMICAAESRSHRRHAGPTHSFATLRTATSM